MRIGCLHTAESNIHVFETALARMDASAVTLVHRVRCDLLSEAQEFGGLTTEIERRTRDALVDLSAEADAVLLTCSTLGPCVTNERIGSVPVVRVDSALANEATCAGGRVLVLCAAETTLGPTTRLFGEAAKKTGAFVEVRLVQGAWPLFMGRQFANYLATIAAAVMQAYGDGADVVALAQASMAGAADLVASAPRPLCSPASGLLTAMRAVRHA
jgi:hypothetical protein